MKQIAIYVEGGGDTAQQKAELRNGFDQLLAKQKQAARDKRLGWKLVPSGGRQAAYKDFINALESADDKTLCILPVDSEEEAPAEWRNRLGKLWKTGNNVSILTRLLVAIT